MSVGIQIDADDLDRLQRRLLKATRIKFDGLLSVLGGMVESQTRNRIQNEKRAPDGGLWHGWSEKYAASKHGNKGHSSHPGELFESQGHTLLSLSGALLDSMHWQTSFDELEVGSNLVYANRQNKARQFIGLSSDDNKEVIAAVERFIDRELGLEP